MKRFTLDQRTLSVCTFSFYFAFVLSFLFEGIVLYTFIDEYELDATVYVFSAIIAHFLGQFTCGFFCNTFKYAKCTVMIGMGLCFLLAGTFFLSNTVIWLLALIVSGYASGCAVAAWGFYLKVYTPKNERMKLCADMLIFSNILMIVINVVAVNLSARIGLIMAMICLLIGMIFTLKLPDINDITSRISENRSELKIRKPMGVLFLFVVIITVDSGLMYQVINPEFERLTFVTSWYWAVPYIVALIVMRNLPIRLNRQVFLYIGLGMIMCAFIAFMILGRNTIDYLVIDTLMLGACGIFDLFWWSIIGEILDYARNPVLVFGIGLSANVFGVLCGDVIGVGVTSVNLPSGQVTVIALCVVCITSIILPPLNRQLTLLLKSHAYLMEYSTLSVNSQESIASSIVPLSPLTEREKEILLQILEGKTNKEISEACFISENTVKTHLKRIYSKYDVSSRAELISLLLHSKYHSFE